MSHHEEIKVIPPGEVLPRLDPAAPCPVEPADGERSPAPGGPRHGKKPWIGSTS
jgi:hypothetical protein